MRDFIHDTFFRHPQSVEETYGEHFAFAMRFGMTLLGAGLAAIVHALVPSLFERTASSTVKRLYPIVSARSAQSMANSKPSRLQQQA